MAYVASAVQAQRHGSTFAGDSPSCVLRLRTYSAHRGPLARARACRCRWLLAAVARRSVTPAPASRPDAVRPVLRQEQHPLRQLRLADLHDRSLRDLLLPRDRAAPRAGRRLRRERVSADQRRPEARPVVQGAADPVQDPQRVRAAERRPRRGAGRRRRVRRAVPPPHAAADRRSAGPALRPHRPRAHAHFEFDIIPQGADPPQRAAVGERRAVRLRARRSGRRST